MAPPRRGQTRAKAARPWPSGALTDRGHRRTTVATETIQSPALNVGCPSSQESPDWSSQLAAAVRRRRLAARLAAVKLAAVKLAAVKLAAVKLAAVSWRSGQVGSGRQRWSRRGRAPPGPAQQAVAQQAVAQQAVASRTTGPETGRVRLVPLRLAVLSWGLLTQWATGSSRHPRARTRDSGEVPRPCGRRFVPLRRHPADAPARGAVALLGEPPLSLADLRSGVTERLNVIPDLRRRLVLASNEWRRPQWVVDNLVDVDRRVQQVTLEDAGCETLEELVSQFFSDPLDPFDSPWEMLLVRGLPSAPPLFEGPSMKPVGQHASAVVVKIHHSLGDSFTLIGALGTLLDQDGGALAESCG